MRVLSICLLVIVLLAHSAIAKWAWVGVKNGKIIPDGAAVSVQELGSMAGQAAAQNEMSKADAAQAESISNQVADLRATVASRQSHAIVHGRVKSYGRAVAPVTNATAYNVSFQVRTEGTNTVGDIFTWFSSAPTNAPRVKACTSLRGGTWAYRTTLSNSWPNTVMVVTTGAVVEAYQTTVRLNPGYQGEFYLVEGVPQLISSDSSIMPFWGGMSINGMTGRTFDYIDYLGHTNHFECGVWTNPS